MDFPGASFLFSISSDPDEAVREGRLREDLLHGARVLSVKVPPLRERPENIPGIVSRLLEEGSGPPPAIEKGVIERLGTEPWPENLRELRSVIARLRIENTRRITLESANRALAARSPACVFPRHLLASEDLPSLKEKLERDYMPLIYDELRRTHRASGLRAAHCLRNQGFPGEKRASPHEKPRQTLQATALGDSHGGVNREQRSQRDLYACPAMAADRKWSLPGP